jgi:hypothetical protein
MSKIILDEDLRAKLSNLDADLELCDASGRTLGHFVPAPVYRELLYAWAKAQFTDEEELKTAREEVRAEGGLRTSEILAHLESLSPMSGR